MKLQKVYVILVASKPHMFDHIYVEPSNYYEDEQQAKDIMNKLIETKEFHFSQLKIQQLWLINKEHRS